MGGIQRYPTPKYLGGSSWLYVKNYRKNLPHLMIPCFLLGLIYGRHFYLTSVASD